MFKLESSVAGSKDVLDTALGKIRDLHVWERNGERAPHKPLLLLLALGKVQAGVKRLLPWNEIETALRQLLVDFGPNRSSVHPEYPFWYLQSDGLWELRDPDLPARRKAGGGKLGNPRVTELRRFNTEGGLPAELYQLVAEDPSALFTLATEILNRHFPLSLHDELLHQVGIHIDTDKFIQYRSPQFHADVLDAYRSSCAVCGFSARLGSRIFGVEATFIRWPAAGGTMSVNNALALCLVHKRGFEWGAFSVDEDGRIILSTCLELGDASGSAFLPFAGRPLREPEDQRARPEKEYLSWHRTEVFRSQS